MYTGETPFKIGDKTLTLVFDWRAMAQAQEAHGKDVFKDLMNAGPEVIADVLAIGLSKNHPDITKEKVLDFSPPMIPAINTINQALLYAYFGPDGPPKDPQTEDTGKKTR